MSSVRHHVLISIGTNIERERHARAGYHALNEYFEDVEHSRVYESEAVGFDGRPFFNWVASAYTTKSIADVCNKLKQIERDNGRVPSDKKFSPRTLDLDLLTYDQEVTSQPINLPREEILYNAFVLQPLAELVPTQRHPECQKTYQELWDAYDKTRQRLWPINFVWSC